MRNTSSAKNGRVPDSFSHPLRRYPAFLAAIALAACSLASCARGELHLSDRHSAAYYPLVEYAKSHPGMTLVLFDYHHDLAADTRGTVTQAPPASWPPERPASFEWLGALLVRCDMARVYWASSWRMDGPERQGRMDWLERSISRLDPQIAARLRDAVVVTDLDELDGLKTGGPLAVSVDLDILAVDPGGDPDEFLTAMLGFIERRKPAQLSFALTSVFQDSPDDMERWMRAALGHGALAGRDTWLLREYVGAPESSEELRAWREWDRAGRAARHAGAGLWADPYGWMLASPGLRASALALEPQAAGQGAADILAAWRDKSYAGQAAGLDTETRRALLGAARRGLREAWSGAQAGVEPRSSRPDAPGLALRLISSGLDRGCMALYRGVEDMEAAAAWCAAQAAADVRYAPVAESEAQELMLELSVFGSWEAMEGPLDFIPGVHSVMVRDANGLTLLQAGIAAQRRLDRERFLGTLCRKAGLAPDAWAADTSLVFAKAATVYVQEPFSGALMNQAKK